MRTVLQLGAFALSTFLLAATIYPQLGSRAAATPQVASGSVASIAYAHSRHARAHKAPRHSRPELAANLSRPWDRGGT